MCLLLLWMFLQVVVYLFVSFHVLTQVYVRPCSGTKKAPVFFVWFSAFLVSLISFFHLHKHFAQ
jgi:hypothetical protein